MQIISNIALISINETLFIQLISFLIFLFLINRIMFRPLRNTMIERDMYIAQIKEDIEGAESELKNMTLQLKRKEESVRKEANKMRNQIEDTGNQEASGILDSSRYEITALQDKTRQEVENQIVEARKTLAKESEALAIQIMEKVLDRRLTQ